MDAAVQKWGNSLAIRIPKPLAGELGLSQGSAVELTLDDGALSVRPKPVPEPTLEELLAEVTEENRHEPVDADDGVGLEVW